MTELRPASRHAFKEECVSIDSEDSAFLEGSGEFTLASS